MTPSNASWHAPNEMFERRMTEDPAQKQRERSQARLEEDGEHDDHFPARSIIFRFLGVVIDRRLRFHGCAAAPWLCCASSC